MKNRVKRLFALLLCVLTAACAVPGAGTAEAAGHSHDGMTPWGDKEGEANSLPTAAGSYYLTRDIELSTQQVISSGEVTLCLNDHSITVTEAVPAIRINGGRFLTGADSTVSVLTKNAGSDSLTVGRGTDGEYPILAISDGSAPLDHNFVNDAGTNLHFTATGTSGDDAIYRLTVNELATEYGVIGSAYASAESYPFALFKNGSFVGAYDK